jgi:hypothetical protein
MKYPLRRFLRLHSFGFSLFIILFLNGCHTLPITHLVQKKEGQVFTEAEILFLNGNFKDAENEYENLLAGAITAQDYQIALYGLACSQLIQAQNDSELLKAIGNLQKWDALKSGEPFVENYHMLILALRQQGELIRKKNTIQTLHDKNKNILIKSQKKKIAQMASIVKKLQNQIEELEKIDQTFQEKRKPL